MDHRDIAQGLLERYYADADRLAERGVASSHDIDLAMRLGAGYPAGPFEARAGRASTAPEPRTGAESTWSAVAIVGTGHMASGIAETVARGGPRGHRDRPWRRIPRPLAGGGQ